MQASARREAQRESGLITTGLMRSKELVSRMECLMALTQALREESKLQLYRVDQVFRMKTRIMSEESWRFSVSQISSICSPNTIDTSPTTHSWWLLVSIQSSVMRMIQVLASLKEMYARESWLLSSLTSFTRLMLANQSTPMSTTDRVLDT